MVHMIAHALTVTPPPLCRLHGRGHANDCKWHFAAQLDIDGAVGYTQNLGLWCLRVKRGSGRNHSIMSLTGSFERWNEYVPPNLYIPCMQQSKHLLLQLYSAISHLRRAILNHFQ